MTLNHPGLGYLAECEYMEMRPALDERDADELLEMIARQSLTYCDRDYMSLDLVVEDAIYGVPRFCIKGAEVPGHDVLVYIKAEDRIGEIVNNQISIEGGQGHMTITRNDNNTYKIHNNTCVVFEDGLVLFYWDSTVTVELKVMTIAFAVQLSLTSEAERVLEKPQSNDMYDSALGNLYSGENDVTSPLDARFAAKAVENKIVTESLFHCRGNQKLILKPISWLWHEEGVFTAFMDNCSQPQIRLLARTYYHQGRMHIVALDADSMEHFRVIGKQRGEYEVRADSESIGGIVHDLETKTAALTSEDDGLTTDMMSRCINYDDQFPFRIFYFDNQDEMLASAVENRATIINIEVHKGVSKVTRKVIFASILIYSWTVLKIYASLPKISISSIFCGCSPCHTPDIPLDQIPLKLTDAQPVPFICVKPCGVNIKKNLIYFNVYRNSGKVIITLECTPEKEFKGIAKLEAKNSIGKLIFTTLNFQEHDLMAVYNESNELIGYLHETMTLSAKKDPYFHTTKHELSNVSVGSRMRLGKACQLRVYHYGQHRSPTKYVNVRTRWNTVEIHIEATCARLRISSDKLACLLSMATKAHTYMYELDELPLPQIDYRYQGADVDCERLLR